MSWKELRRLLNLFKDQLSINKNNKMPFYAVAKGRTVGIYMNWSDCETQVKGFPGARYKKFDSIVDAQQFITIQDSQSVKKVKSPRTSLPNSSSNLKRTSSSISIKNSKVSNEKASQRSKIQKISDCNSGNWEDSDDDLNAVLMKQMDDIEKRINGVKKGVDKIYKQSAKNKKTILIENCENNGFKTDEDGYVHVYTDGACSSNGQRGAQAGLGVYWGEGHPLNISAPVSGRATNNCGEIQAATQAIKTALENGIKLLAINTDSKFLINSVTKWFPAWKQKGWITKSGDPVKNVKDFKDLDKLLNKVQIKWNYVEAHRGVHGNEMADQLAKTGATMYKL